MAFLLRGIKLSSFLRRGTRGELIRGVGATLLVRGAGAALSLVVSIVLARLLGADGFGVYAYCLAVVSLLAIPAQFGAGTVLVRYVAAYERQGQWSLLLGLLKWANQFVLISSVILAVLTAVTFVAFPGLMPSEERSTLWLALLLLPIVALGDLRAAALRGFRRFVKGQLPEMILRPGGVLLVVFSLSSLSYQLSSFEVMLTYLLVSLAAFILGAWWLWQAFPANFLAARSAGESKKWAETLSVLSLSRGGRVALNRMDLVFVGSLAGAEAAAIYRVATALVSIVAFSLNAINTVIGPYFSKFHVLERQDKNKQLLLASGSLSAALALPLVVALYIWGERLIAVTYGRDFVSAFAPLLILCVGQFLNAAAGPVGILTNMTGQEKWSLLAVGSALLLAIPSYVFVVPLHGVLGAAAITAVALILINAILLVRVWIVPTSTRSQKSLNT